MGAVAPEQWGIGERYGAGTDPPGSGCGGQIYPAAARDTRPRSFSGGAGGPLRGGPGHRGRDPSQGDTSRSCGDGRVNLALPRFGEALMGRRRGVRGR